MDRYIVPLTSELCFVQFRRPGENVIHATIVWENDSTNGTVKKVFTARYDIGTYKATVLTSVHPGVMVLQSAPVQVGPLHWAMPRADAYRLGNDDPNTMASLGRVCAKLSA